jgi:hypothetical protein
VASQAEDSDSCPVAHACGERSFCDPPLPAFSEQSRSCFAPHACTPALDAALRERARTGGQSLNEAALEALMDGAGLNGVRRKRRDLSDIIGMWKPDKAFEDALAAQDQIEFRRRPAAGRR